MEIMPHNYTSVPLMSQECDDFIPTLFRMFTVLINETVTKLNYVISLIIT